MNISYLLGLWQGVWIGFLLLTVGLIIYKKSKKQTSGELTK